MNGIIMLNCCTLLLKTLLISTKIDVMHFKTTTPCAKFEISFNIHAFTINAQTVKKKTDFFNIHAFTINVKTVKKKTTKIFHNKCKYSCCEMLLKFLYLLNNRYKKDCNFSTEAR